MSIFKKLKENHNAQMQRKAERMQGFTMQAELSATIVRVELVASGAESSDFLVEYASGEKREERVQNDSSRYAELMLYVS